MYKISGERIIAVYDIVGNETEAYSKAKDICLEQTVELPYELVPEGVIRHSILGKIESFLSLDDNIFEVKISFAVETIGFEISQLLNVVFGNISIKPNIRLKYLELPKSFLKKCKGPRFGIQGLRRIVKVKDRPLLCSALKPMGFTAQEHAELAYRFALGGIDIIKDDHGITNQNFALFEKRVKLCVNAVKKANSRTKQNCIYVANVTAPFNVIVSRAKIAKKMGAGGIMVAPGIIGFDTMRCLAEDKSISLPIFSHPAMQGTYVLNRENGMSHSVLFGQINRVCGADAAVYPNFGGRFPFTQDDCQDIVIGASIEMGSIRKMFPCPGGGMSLQNMPDIVKFYGKDVIFLVGGGLLGYGPDLVENCKYLKSIIER